MVVGPFAIVVCAETVVLRTQTETLAERGGGVKSSDVQGPDRPGNFTRKKRLAW
jgi:hypothetical protein